MAAILTGASHQLPVSERSMDHMAHLLYGLDAASQTQAVATLANHMEPADFNRLQSSCIACAGVWIGCVYGPFKFIDPS